MRLLIVTQTVDRRDPILGFFHSWIEEFAKTFSNVTVICLGKGEYSFDSNVVVYSLGKENGASRLALIGRFYKYIIQNHKKYDVVFVHMNPIYLVLGGLFWKLAHKKIGLWYVHKSVDLKLRLGSFFADYIFTASPESFRLKSNKTKIVGHGIQTDKFKPDHHTASYRIVTVGRISRTKNIKRMIEVFALLAPLPTGYDFTVIGDGVTLDDLKYKSEIMLMAKKLDLDQRIHFIGSKNQDELARVLPQYDIFLNFSDTGSVDKAVLEAASSGLKIFTTNIAFSQIFPQGFLDTKKPDFIMEKIISTHDISSSNRDIVIENYNLHSLVQKIKGIYEKNNK